LGGALPPLKSTDDFAFNFFGTFDAIVNMCRDPANARAANNE